MFYNSFRFTENVNKVLEYAGSICEKLGQNQIATEHLLFGITSVPDCAACKILNSYGINSSNLLKYFNSSSFSFSAFGFDDELELTPRSKDAFLKAQQIAISLGQNFISPEHLLLAILFNPDSFATRIIVEGNGVNLNEIKSKIMSVLKESDSSAAKNFEDEKAFTGSEKTSKSPLPESLLEMGTDLTQKAREKRIDPVIGREAEIERIIEILCRKTKNNPVLIGEAGVGKSAIVEGLASKIVEGDVPDLLKDKNIFSLEIGGLMAGTKYRGALEEKLKNCIETIIESKNIIVFIDEIHTLAMAGHKEGEVNPADMLKPYLSRGELQTIGATTTDEYRQFIEKDKALERRFQPIMVNPPTVEQTIQILNGLRDSYEAFHKVKITDEAIKAAAELSDRYIQDRSLPDKAIDLIDEASSRAKVQFTESQEVKNLKEQLEKLESEKEAARISENYEKAGQLRDEIYKIQGEIRDLSSDYSKLKQQDKSITAEDIAKVVSSWTGVPVTKINETEKEKLLNLENILHERVIGQNDAVVSVSKAIRRARAGLKDPNKPIGSFLFLGPTGVGKTELSKALAQAMFDSEDLIIRLDMSEYMESHSVSKLIGAPPGYVGFDDGGQLTEQVRRKPYSVVLFDEIEKAHPDVFNILLQVLDDGRLTDSNGRTVSFKNTIIIMTSNVGISDLNANKTTLGFGDHEAEKENRREILMDAVKRKFKPEFINRIDVITIFDDLTIQDIARICEIFISNLKKKLAKQGIELSITKNAITYLVKKGYNKEYGARPLKRIVQSEIEDRLADEILSGKFDDNKKIIIDEQNGQLYFSN